jgi:hypothetical protein
MAEPESLLITRWISQGGAPPALEPHYVGIDDRGFPEILADAAHFAGFVRFFDERDTAEGSWEELIAADETAVLALLATMEPKGRAREIEGLAERIRDEPDPLRKLELLVSLIVSVIRLAARIDRWLRVAGGLGQGGGGAAFRLLEEAVSADLAPNVRRIAAAAQTLPARDSILAPVETFLPLWRIGIAEIGGACLDPGGGLGGIDDIVDAAVGYVRGIETLAAGSAAEIEASLEASDHPPHMGLLMAFIRLFRHAQSEINALPRRIADFYQREMLRERPAPAEPDSLFLTFVPVPVPVAVADPVSAAPAAQPEIAAGTAFPAGADAAGTPILFAADTSLAVTGATVGEVRIWKPELEGERLLRIAAETFAVGPDGAIGRRLLGATGLPAANPGLIVAAPLLALRTGARRVTISFLDLRYGPAVPWWDRDSFPPKSAFRVAYYSESGWIDVEDFSFARAIPLPADAGPAIAAERPLPLQAELNFAIAADGPALAPWPASGAAPLPAVRLMIDQDAVPDAPPLALLAGMTFGSIRIQVEVDGLGELEVWTPDGGPIPALSGLAPFGSPPVRGGWLRIGHPAFEIVRADCVALGLTWLGLPADWFGFTTYYEQYRVGPNRVDESCLASLFTNRSFRVRVSAPVRPEGRILDDVALFTTKVLREDEAPISDGSADDEPSSLASAPESPVPAPSPCDPGPYVEGPGDTFALRATSWFILGQDSSKSGPGQCADRFLTVTLTDPPYAFGDSIYAVNIAYATAEIAAAELKPGKTLGRRTGDRRHSARPTQVGPFLWLWRQLAGLFRSTPAEPLLLSHSPEDLPPFSATDPAIDGDGPSAAIKFLPNPPWRPTLADIRLNYRAHAAWDGKADSGAVAIFHVVPLVGPVPVPLVGRPLLLPALPARPCFDLAIAGWRSGYPLSLLFRTGAPPAGDLPPSPVAWQFVDTALGTSEARIVSDGTAGLSGTGIVVAAPPSDTAGTTWLRAVAEGATEGFPEMVGIVADALAASRLVTGSENALPPVLAGTITQAPGTRGIAAVSQPLASFGGSPAGGLAGLPARTSARLRHKERAILGWDVERLLLERFPGIARVRVLPAREPASVGVVPGHMVVVVVPAEGGLNPPDPLRPAAAPELRAAIGRWLAERCSPFARIHVVDPIYDPVAVDVGAFFTGPNGPAMLIDDLAALLSPWAEPGLDLPDQAGPGALQGRIVRFVGSRPYVAGVRRVTATLAEDVPCGQWRVPVAGSLIVSALDGAPPAAGC